MPKNNDAQRPQIIKCSTIMRATDRLKAIIGREAVEAILSELKKHGIDCEDRKKTCTMSQIHDGLKNILDQNAAEMLVAFISFEMTR